jgi:PKD repeat protein
MIKKYFYIAVDNNKLMDNKLKFQMKKLLLAVLVLSIISCHKDKDDTKSYPAPVAKFTIQPNDGIAPEEISFTNQSKNAEDYVWFFGDGQASEEFSPTHNFKNSGGYVVKLKVFGPGGKDSVMQVINLATSNQSYYNVLNLISVTLDNVRSFYLDWDAMKVYDIVDHGSMAYNNQTDDIATSRPSIEVIFKVNNKYYHMAYPDPLILNDITTITIYDTSSCWIFDTDPISTSSMVHENIKDLRKIKDALK